MAYSPTTWVAPGADGRLEVFVVGSDHDGGQSPAPMGDPPATAGRIGAHTEPRQMQMVCAGPPRSHRPQTGAWKSSSSETIFNPTAWDPVERFTGHRRPPATVSGPVGVHTRRAGRTCSVRRLLFAVPMATSSCLYWATTQRCGTCGR